MLLGYNTNGFAHHRLEDAIEILADLGYQSVALTLDYHALDPYGAELDSQLGRVEALLSKHGMRCVIETGARFLLDPRRKHQPTLLDADEGQRQRRVDFLVRAVDIAARLGADAVSFWSGAASGERGCVSAPSIDSVSGTASASESPSGRLRNPAHPLELLVDGCRQLCDIAAERGVRLAFEPEPGMLIDTMATFEQLHGLVDHPAFGLTLDVGHLQCLGEVPMRPYFERWRSVLWNVHIEDMRTGVHDHLMFGEGEMDFVEVLAGLREVGYTGGLHVELSRHSHDAVQTARRSLAFLRERLN